MLAGSVKDVTDRERCFEKMMSAVLLATIVFLSKIWTRKPSGDKPPGRLHEIVGVSPAPDMVTEVGIGIRPTPTIDGPVTVAIPLGARRA